MSGFLLDTYPSGSTVYAFFNTYDANGASLTMSNFAVGDILIYKNGSTTQRTSTAGFTLLDTDGTDFDTITGIHGLSIDLSNNTDAGFYAVGSQYTVVISSITVNSQTVSFVLGSFRIVAAEATAGYPAVTVKVGTGTGEINVSSGAIPVSSLASGAIVAATFAAGAINAAAIADGAIDAGTFAAGAIDAAALAASAGAEIADAVWDETLSAHLTAGSTGAALNAVGTAADPWLTSLPGAYGAGTAGNILGNNLNASVSSRADQTTVDTIATAAAAVKSKTDNLTFTTSGQVDANIQYVNDVAVTGTGASGNEWRPT